MKPLRLLLLEDNLLDAELLLNTPSNKGIGCDALRVEQRDAFESALHSGSWDIILADYSLSSFDGAFADGASALQMARDCCPDTPFIFVSGQMYKKLLRLRGKKA